MTYNIKTIAYFAVWGLIYGALLGAFSGTAILPYFGTIYATIWGAGIGLASGILSGVVAAVVRVTSFDHDTDLDTFRRRLSLSIGALVAVFAPILLLLTTNGFLWGSGMLRDMLPWTALSLFSASLWGGLSGAYIASHYTAFIAQLTARREYDDIDIEVPQARREVSNALVTLMRAGFTRWVFLLGAAAGGFVNLMNGSNFASFSDRAVGVLEGAAYFGIGGILGMLGTFFLGLYVAFGTGALLTFLKRLIFREYFSHLPPHWTRWILTLTAFVFTGAVTYWSMIFAPVIALITAYTVYHTLALPDESPEKAKRKEKNALALDEEGDAEDDRLLLEEEALMETEER